MPPVDAGSGGGGGGADGGTIVPDSGLGGGFDAGPFEPDSGLGVGDGGGIGGDGGGFGPLGSWSYDDCNTERTNLFDSSPNFNTAFRSVNVACGAGIAGQAVSLSSPAEDIVTVPDQPNFLFDTGVTAAGWFNPNSINQTSTLLRKRDDSTSAFALLLHQGRYMFVVNLGRGRAASVTSRSRAVVGRWTHVAGTYDGTMLRLYVDGTEVASARTRGPILNTSGPVVIGNDGSHRLFPGLIDNSFLDSRALSPAEVQGLLCIRGIPTAVGTPAISAPTLPGTPAVYDITVTNNDSPACAPSDFFFSSNLFDPGFDLQPRFQFLPQVPGGGSAHVSLSVTANDLPDPGTFTIPFDVFSQSPGFGARGSVDFVLASTGCRVRVGRELTITHPSVVDDPSRTRTRTSTDTSNSGVWSFQHLMESIAPTPADAPAMVEAMLNTFGTTPVVNGFAIEPRPGMQSFVLANWPRINGALDLSRAPLTLQAIVNRFDLQDPASGDAGEGRFVFAFDGPGGAFPLQATLILEFKLPANSPAEVDAWAQSWHALGGLPFPSEEYNAALERITERFVARGARPGHTNGSAISTVRTNEIDLGDNGRWQLREFRLDPVTGFLAPNAIDRTPDLGFNGTPVLADFINQNEASIISETHTVPAQFQGSPFGTGAVFNDLIPWTAPGINNNEARFHFAANTCNGCHSQETNTFFLQITPRFPGGEATLSAFLTGTTVFDPVTGAPRTLNELGRRSSIMRPLVCP